ncbi:hypothetical protein [Granulicella sp. 5B5]|uniref:hypothetical protein n=1 Tax=Granulicella sp. 5B5 TaxID=1617967 RepID=UPI00210830E0|nr:hypothetical protein [Granulicella sp. 5B5]
MTSRTLAAIFLASALTLTGCKHAAAPETTTATPTTTASNLPPATPAVDPATAGTITGAVKFDGKAPRASPST